MPVLSNVEGEHDPFELPPPEWPSLAVTGLVEITDCPIDFTPVPRLRKRRGGWSPEAQRAFIAAALARTRVRAHARPLRAQLCQLPAHQNRRRQCELCELSRPPEEPTT